MGCQQKNKRSVSGDEKKEKESLDVLEGVCLDRDWIRWTRYFGCATFMLAIALFVLVLEGALNGTSNPPSVNSTTALDTGTKGDPE